MSEAYRAAGVDREAAAEAVSLIADLAAGTRREGVLSGVGGFAGLFSIGGGRLLAAATDGVGTKLEIARRADRLEGVGIDLVAMCADDVVCTGAEPLFFLDYLSVGSLDAGRVARIVEGIAEGCRRAGCALLGGETAEHPGVMEDDEVELAGFCVGTVAETDLLSADRVRVGDALIGLPSSGLHSNGFSLVRSAVLGRYQLDDRPPGLDRDLVDELLEPCAIYAPTVLELAGAGLLRAAAHITGGGLVENVPRVLPEGAGASLHRGTWNEPPIFGFIGRAAGASDAELFGVLNMGLGMVLIVDSGDADEVASRAGPGASAVGEVVAGSGVSFN